MTPEPPSIPQRAQLASLIAGGALTQARTYAANQTAQGGTDWRRCPEWPLFQVVVAYVSPREDQHAA